MIIKNGSVFCPDGKLHDKTIYVADKIVLSESDKEKAYKDKIIIDATDKYVIPGLVDIHSHGAVGCDFCDASKENLEKILKYERSVGVTSYCPTSMTLPFEDLKKIFETTTAIRKTDDMAKIVGINMEGPFISEKKKGAQNAKYIKSADIEAFCELNASCGNLIKLVTLAPETNGALDFIEELKDEVNISVGHTDANFQTAAKAFSLGANHVTHLFNAMPPFHHRDTGVVGAAFDNKDVYVEVICDGIHIAPSMIRAIFKIFGSDRVVLISDSMEATGMPDGEYMLGGQKVYKKGNHATLSDNTLAGSATNLFDCMKNAVAFGIPLEDAIKSATMTPAKSIGIFPTAGAITENQSADILILNEDLTPEKIL
ncbi:MAG: N-acetylglucosamine-6-phosphate deacetylase [Lachnospiraceae bacterium]|nr:N-acetylglucosamine-6-phosphate deacetylase [Lachnospiraceae bacterium]